MCARVVPEGVSSCCLTDKFQLRRIKQDGAVDVSAAKASARTIAPPPAANAVRHPATNPRDAVQCALRREQPYAGLSLRSRGKQIPRRAIRRAPACDAILTLA